MEDFPDIVCFNDKQILAGNPVYLSIRPEKIRISRDKPEDLPPHVNLYPAKVEDVIYLGSTTKYWVRMGEYRISLLRQHGRFFLDEKPIRWQDDVWIWWHSDDGFMLERYSEKDESLNPLPPEKVGEESDEEASFEK